MSRIRLLQGLARGLAKAAKSPAGKKAGQAALKQANRLKSAAKGAKPIARKSRAVARQPQTQAQLKELQRIAKNKNIAKQSPQPRRSGDGNPGTATTKGTPEFAAAQRKAEAAIQARPQPGKQTVRTRPAKQPLKTKTSGTIKARPNLPAQQGVTTAAKARSNVRIKRNAANRQELQDYKRFQAEAAAKKAEQASRTADRPNRVIRSGQGSGAANAARNRRIGEATSSKGYSSYTGQGDTAPKVKRSLFPNRPAKSGTTQTTSGTKRAPGVTNDATNAPPRSRSTRLPKSEQIKQVKSNLRDRGAQHVQTKVPADTNATTNRARGSVVSTADGRARGKYSEANKETARQAVRRGQAESRVSGDVRENGRTAGRNAAQSYKGKAAKAISNRMSTDKALDMSGVERRALRDGLETRAKAGEARVRQAAEDAVTGTQRSSKLNQSPSSSSQDIGRTGSRRSLAQTQASAKRLSLDMDARSKAGKLPEIKKDLPSTGGPKPASTEVGVKKAVTPPKKDLTSSQTAKRLAKPEDNPRPISNGKELKPQGQKSVPNSMNTSDRRANPSAQQARSDAALRQRNRRGQGSRTAANRSVGRDGINYQKIMESNLRERGYQ